MPDLTPLLGGRLPLLDPATLTTEQRDAYQHIEAHVVPWAERVGFEIKTADGRLIGPFNSALFSPLIAQAFLALQSSEKVHTALSDRVRQVVILSIGSIWNAAYELYAHAAAARAAGFSNDAIRDLTSGQTPDELNLEEQIAQQFTLQLAAERKVSAEVYQVAVRHFSEKGLVDMIMLAGCYHLVCSLLNAFSLPAPEPRLFVTREA